MDSDGLEDTPHFFFSSPLLHLSISPLSASALSPTFLARSGGFPAHYIPSVPHRTFCAPGHAFCFWNSIRDTTLQYTSATLLSIPPSIPTSYCLSLLSTRSCPVSSVQCPSVMIINVHSRLHIRIGIGIASVVMIEPGAMAIAIVCTTGSHL